jgi:NTE family protein
VTTSPDAADAGGALGSAALGTSLHDLIRPCPSDLRPRDPDPAEPGPTLGLTFSGGGFRATLSALGVIRFLADAGTLADVRYVSSVSGGSIANGRLAMQWPALRAEGFTAAAVDRLVIDPIVDRVSTRSLKHAVLADLWRAVGRSTRTDVLARTFDRWFFERQQLEDLDPQCRFIVNAANLHTGVRFGFEQDVFGDYVVGLLPTGGTGLRLATAVAASAAVPGVFAPVVLRDHRFPCGDEAPALLDGGAYDNTGLEPLDSDRYRHVFTITLNAGGVFVTGGYGKVPLVRDLARANSLLYRQSTSLRTRWMVDRFRAWEGAVAMGTAPPPHARQGILFGLASTIDGSAVDRFAERFAEHRTWRGRDLAFVPTVFDRLDEALCRLLVYRGWWLTGAALARFHPASSPPIDTLVPPPLVGGVP